MSDRFSVGSFVGGGGDVVVDVMRLVDSRLLVQANSGGGKSWFLRKVVESVGGSVQFVVFDPEGEFSTLRELLDCLLVGPDGDVAAQVGTAGKLSRKLLEHDVSAVVDLSDLNWGDRREFVGAFLVGLMRAPRRLWRPLLVVVDEAHMFAPESGKVGSTEAVSALMCQGRKRGFCGVLATQRLSKLHKDSAAECNNVVIGRTAVDVDVQRAGDVLGLSRKDALGLRDLSPGSFFGFGPAFDFGGVQGFRVGGVVTSHPVAGKRMEPAGRGRDGGAVGRPATGLGEVLEHFSDLGGEVEREALDLAGALKRIGELEGEVRELRENGDPSPQPSPRGGERGPEDVDGDWLVEQKEVAYRAGVGDGRREVALGVVEFLGSLALDDGLSSPGGGDLLARRSFDLASLGLAGAQDDGLSSPGGGGVGAPDGTPHPSPLPRSVGEGTGGDRGARSGVVARSGDRPQGGSSQRGVAVGLGSVSGKDRMLIRLAQLGRPVSRKELGLLCGLSWKGGTFGTYLSALKSSGFVRVVGRDFEVTDAGRAAVGDPPALPSGGALRDWWAEFLGGGGKRVIFEVLCGVYPDVLSRDGLGERAGLSSRGGTFGTYLSALSTLGLVEKVGGGYRAARELFLE